MRKIVVWECQGRESVKERSCLGGAAGLLLLVQPRQPLHAGPWARGVTRWPGEDGGGVVEGSSVVVCSLLDSLEHGRSNTTGCEGLWHGGKILFGRYRSGPSLGCGDVDMVSGVKSMECWSRPSDRGATLSRRVW